MRLHRAEGTRDGLVPTRRGQRAQRLLYHLTPLWLVPQACRKRLDSAWRCALGMVRPVAMVSERYGLAWETSRTSSNVVAGISASVGRRSTRFHIHAAPSAIYSTTSAEAALSSRQEPISSA